MDKLNELLKRIDTFNKERDWDQFHSPTNLSKSISIEAAELLECFQWSDDYNIKITTPFDLKIFKLLKEENYD